MDVLPVVAVRLLDGRVGSTLLMQLLATSEQVALERRYPEGELRYLSYCLRVAEWVATPWDPTAHPGVTELLFGPADRGGPIPFTPSLVDPSRLAPSMLAGMWAAMSEELRRSTPVARYYAEKLVGDGQLLIDSAIPLRIIDLVPDPRDVFCSIRAFSGDGAGFGRDRTRPTTSSSSRWPPVTWNVFARWRQRRRVSSAFSSATRTWSEISPGTPVASAPGSGCASTLHVLSPPGTAIRIT